MPKLRKAIDRQLSYLGINEAEDDIFLEIRGNKTLKKLEVTFYQTNLLTALFGLLFFYFGLVAHFGYSHKTHLEYLGLVSFLHIISGSLGWIALRKQNRYFLFYHAILNILWLTFVSFLVVICLFFITSADWKAQFNNEIVFHIGLIFYYPLALTTTIANLIIINLIYLIRIRRGPRIYLKRDSLLDKRSIISIEESTTNNRK